MLYAFFIIACLCSNYIVASEKEQQDKIQKKAYYDKIISEKIKDDKERAKYNEGYIVVGDDELIIAYSDIEIPVGVEGCFMSFPINHPIHEQLKKQAMEKNNNDLVINK